MFFLTILYSLSNSNVNSTYVLGSIYFYMFLFYDWLFLHMCILQENLLFSGFILGSVFSDYVVFYGDTFMLMLCW